MTRCAMGLLLAAAVGAQAATPSMHPGFHMLDEGGRDVLATGGAVSTMATCGQCHDTEYIAGHSFHATLGLDQVVAPGTTGSGRAWDTSPGLFGRWNPMTYEYLTPDGDSPGGLGTAAWVRMFGARHVGGGPAYVDASGHLLTTHGSSAGPGRDTQVTEDGQRQPWDWQDSGAVEMNCFLCHSARADNEARVRALADGAFRWASTATLAQTGMVVPAADGWQWQEEAFDGEGRARPEVIGLQDPANRNCGFCHGLVQVDETTPLAPEGCQPDHWSTETTGQIVSGQRLSDSGMNLAGKDGLSRSFDVHAERLVGCTQCHFSLNNPAYSRRRQGQPGHLAFDGRRLDIGEYLRRPSHQFAKGYSTQGQLSPELDDSMRRCESCHLAEATHEWLPYWQQHAGVLACEACHIPKLYSGARQQYDWTMLTAEGKPLINCRGVEGRGHSPAVLATGYVPVLLPRQEIDGRRRLAPHNLVSSWYWVTGDPPRPVGQEDLATALLTGDGYHPAVVRALDRNGDGRLRDDELHLVTPQQADAVRRRLEDIGLDQPRIAAEIQPYGIHHSVTTGTWALRDCGSCHGQSSRLTQPFELASYMPGNVMPQLVGDAPTSLVGTLHQADDGALVYTPSMAVAGMYVLGHDARWWSGGLGLAVVLVVLTGVVAHGSVRWLRRGRQTAAPVERVYMHGGYERLWHWLQALAIMGLIGTGLEVNLPDTFGVLGFSTAVRVHNALALLLVINALLAVLYHLASGQIGQFVPNPGGFFTQALQQARYYLTGIFQGQSHPFVRHPQRRLNPLQQITYLAILNILLPLQVLTGAAMWGGQRWPEVAARMGGLSLLAPVHGLIGWLFAGFLIMHIYLTTTGHTPLASIRAMIHGWEEVARPAQDQEQER